MKKSRTYFSLILLVSLLPLFGIFSTSQLLHTHDGLVHLPRIAAYYKALQDGEFPVRWAGDLNYGYGMPLFNFIYQLPYLVASVFVFLGTGLVNAFKISLSLSFIISAVSIFLFARNFFNDNKKAFLVAIFYQFSPFRFVELLIRGSFGEVYTYAFFPLVLYGITRLHKKISYTNFLITSVATFLLIFSHNALSLVFFIVCAVFILVFAKSKKSLIASCLSLLSGLLLASFYWMPAILEHKFTYGDLFMKTLYLSHFPPIQNFFIPNFTNDIHLQTQGISVQFGIFHVVAVILSIIVLLTKKVDRTFKKLILFNLVILLVTLFIMTPLSKPIWAHMSLLRQFQFPWRFLGLVSFCTSFLAVSFLAFQFFNKKFVYIGLLVLVVLSTAWYWKPALGYDKINENYYWNFPLNTTYYGETDVIWSAGPAHSYPKQRVEFIEGNGVISNFTKKTTVHTFNVTAKSQSTLVDHTEYFPGWKAFVDNIQVPIQFQNPNQRGEITFPVSKGTHVVKVSFGEDKLRFLSDMISLLALVMIVVLGIFRKKILYETKGN